MNAEEKIVISLVRDWLKAYDAGDVPLQESIALQIRAQMSYTGITVLQLINGITSQDDPEDPIADDDDGGRPADLDFADPGGESSLYAATDDDPRVYPCPSCERPNKLTRRDVRARHQCNRCANELERGG